MNRSLDELRGRVKARLKGAAVIASDETTTRIDGVTHWPLGCLLTPVAAQGGSFACWLGWTFVTEKAVLHEIAPRRAKAVAEAVLGDHRPEVWISDRYAGQQELAAQHQVCLAHVLRDVQYAFDRGDEAFAPKLRELLRWAIRIGRRRDDLKGTTLAQYHGPNTAPGPSTGSTICLRSRRLAPPAAICRPRSRLGAASTSCS